MELDNGSAPVRTSHRETHAVRRRPAPRAVGEAASQLVQSICAAGPILRNHLDVERMKQPLQKGVFYVAENEGQAEPGFLVFLAGQAPVFLQMKKHARPPCTLRMRVSTALAGTVFAATLDDIAHTLRLEDVWMWRGERIFDTTPYSKRRAFLREFVDQHWIPDSRLMGGITTHIVSVTSVEKALGAARDLTATSLEFFPEQPGRRRLWIRMAELLGAGEPAPVIPAPVAAPPPPPPPKPLALQRAARAVPVEKMPDVYDLFDIEGLPISRASVQSFALSQQLRVAAQAPHGSWVQVLWKPEFGGYEIEKILKEPPSPVQSKSAAAPAV